MALSVLPLGYCTNVHPGRTVAEVLAGLDRFTVPVRERIGGPVAAGLWLARPVVDELLATPDGPYQLADGLAARGLSCHTLNAFPYGDFHAARVKENVYLPDWSRPERLAYTVSCAAILAGILPEGAEGSISTLPLTFKAFDRAPGFAEAAARQLVDCAKMLAHLRAEDGPMIRLAIEPEPFCMLETTTEAIAFFDRLWELAGPEERAAREHLGICYDICHQAVEFEDAAVAVHTLDRAGIRINKVQISCAIHLDSPADNSAGREALARYVEPRYLHQTFARLPDGRVVGTADLTESFLAAPPPDFLAAVSWRVHFHVPVDAERLGALATTKPAVAETLDAIATLDYAPHLEVETYTWNVMPGDAPVDLVDGLSRELTAARELILAAGGRG